MPSGKHNNHKVNSGCFKKGHINSEEDRKKRSERMKGHKLLGNNPGTKGKHWKMSEQGRKNIGNGHKGLVPPMLGKNQSEETKRKISISHTGKHTGDKCNFWKGGITPLIKQIRSCLKMRQWKCDVFTRDDYICQGCEIRGCYLEAHHKESFSVIFQKNNIRTFEEALNCEELWNINNGVTLCRECHKLTDNYKNKRNVKNIT